MLSFITLGVNAQGPYTNSSVTQTVCISGVADPYGVINTTGSTYLWTIVEGTTPADWVLTTTGNLATVLWKTPGNYTVRVLETNLAGCTNLPVEVTVTVNPLPTAIIAGATTVCQNDVAPNITFTGANGTAPYTFTYKINGGTDQTITTSGVNSSITVVAPTTISGTFTYSLVSISDASTTHCSQTQTGSAVITVNPLPTAIIAGTTNVCKNGTEPNVTFTGANGTAPYTFTYKIDGGTDQTITTSGVNSSITVAAPTTVSGPFTYSLVSISDASTTHCSQAQTGSAVITVNTLPDTSPIYHN
jgi:large repetitive protein